MRKFCLSIVALATIVTTFAQNVPFETAQQIAVNFFSTTQSNGIQKNNPVLQSYIGGDNGENLYYIFNYENQGFVVVAGDYQSTPILAYSTEGTIDLEKLNPAMKMWLESHGQAVKNTTLTNSQKDLIKKEWDNILNNSIPVRKASKVGPFTTSVWNQDRYYNAYCPEDLNVTGEIGGNYDNHVPNGCVAVAMSQIMYYHRFPYVGVDKNSYVSPYGRLSADFSTAYYNYEAMSDIATDYSHSLALLIYHAGISVEMNYAPTGSGSQTEKARMSLMGYFGYSATSRYERKEMYSNSVWLSKIAESLDSRLPIIYSGRKVDADAGHAWICDGYESLTDTTAYLHFNWGWGTKGGNGWFLSTIMNGYTIGETAIFGLTPKVDLPTCAHDTLTATYGSFYSNAPTVNYPHNADCSWLISTPNATSIRLSVSEFATELGNDVVTVYAGNSTSDSIVWMISGDTITSGTYIDIEASEALITFTSNESESKRGFVFTYTTTLSNPKYCNTSIDPGTGNVLTTTSGTLNNGSGNENYVNSNACYWRIEPTGATGVWIDVTEFDLADGDELSIYAHEKTVIQAIKFTDRIAQYTKDNPPTGILTSPDKKKIYIMFRTDNDKVAKGWALKWGIDVGISETDIADVNIYPNPTNNILNINVSTNSPVDNMKIHITDITGRLVYVSEINQQSLQINVGDFAKGIYVLTLLTDKGNVNRKIVVQ